MNTKVKCTYENISLLIRACLREHVQPTNTMCCPSETTQKVTGPAQVALQRNSVCALVNVIAKYVFGAHDRIVIFDRVKRQGLLISGDIFNTEEKQTVLLGVSIDGVDIISAMI